MGGALVSFDDTVKKLLRMPPKPHKGEADEDEKDDGQDEPGRRPANRSESD